VGTIYRLERTEAEGGLGPAVKEVPPDELEELGVDLSCTDSLEQLALRRKRGECDVEAHRSSFAPIRRVFAPTLGSRPVICVA
jgi:hypothetical protein